MDTIEPGDEATAARGFAFTAAVLMTLFAAAVATQLLGGGWGGASALLWPTSWGFYADSAHREYVVAYRPGEGGTVRRLTRPIADRENRWGLGHSAYADVIRLLELAAAVPADAWRPCAAERIELCAGVVARAPVTTVDALRGMPPGRVVLAVERPAHPHDGATRRLVRVAVLDLTPPR